MLGEFVLHDMSSASDFTTSLSFRAIIQGIRMKFPSVKSVTTAILQQWMDGGVTTAPTTDRATDTDGKDKKLIIIDARPELEYSVSHIAKSINVNFETDDMESVKKLMVQEAKCESPGLVAANVVLYCSVGYRSSVLTDKIQKATTPDPAFQSWQFFNLEGSLFKWTNENRPLVDQQGQPTEYIHPFNGVWGRLVDTERWKSIP